MIFLHYFECFITTRGEYSKRWTEKVREGSVKGLKTYGCHRTMRGIIIGVIGRQTKSSATQKAGGT